MRRTLSRRTFLAAAGVLGATAALGGCDAREPLRIALHTWPGYEFMRLAARLGWLPPERVRIVNTGGFTASVEALRAGTVGAAGVTLDEVLKLREAALPVKVALVFDVSVGADVLLVRPGIDSLAQLRGRRIGVETTTLGSLLLGRALQQGGLARADVEIVPLTIDPVAAWTIDALDAVVTYEPALSRLRRLGLVPIFDSRQLPQLIVDVLAVRDEAMRLHPQALREALAGHFRALTRWRVNAIDTSYRLAAQLRVPPEQVASLYRGLDLPDAIYNREYLTPPATEMMRASTELSRILVEDRVLHRPVSPTGLFVADFLPGDAA